MVISAAVSPDLVRLADQAGAWAVARSQAEAAGVVEASLPAPKPNLSLLPKIDTTTTTEPTEPAENPEPNPDAENPEPDPGAEEPEPDPDAEEPEPDPDAENPEPDPDAENPETDPGAEEPDPDPEVGDDDGTLTPTPPVQVNGRVPPPAGGPTAEQWDALRKCESTHNYRAVNPSGKFRGAYQFSIQTWDWVAGIHQPHLVGIDPIDADPAWQDVMAYTLYAMSGWGQWPECGVYLL